MSGRDGAHERGSMDPLASQTHDAAVGEAATPSFLQKSAVFFSQPVVASFVAGGVAGAVSRTVVSPLGEPRLDPLNGSAD